MAVTTSSILKVAILTEQKANTTNASAASSSYTARILNTLSDPQGIVLNPASFTGTGGTNTQFQLGAGTYVIVGYGPFQVGGTQGSTQTSKMRLQNITDSTTVALGTNMFDVQLSAGSTPASLAPIEGQFTITSTKTFELQQRCSNATSTGTLGFNCNYGDNEVYASLKIQKIL